MAQTIRYKIYDIETGDNFANVKGVSGNTVKSFKTERQAKAWIDREHKLSQERVQSADLQAWYIGGDTWNIATLDAIQTVGQIKIDTSRKCVEDQSGLKKFKVRCKNELTLTLRLGYHTDITLTDKFIEYGGPRAALRKAMDWITEGQVFYHIRTQLEAKCRQAGLPEFQIIDAYHSDWRKHCLSLANLLPEVSGE